MNDLIWFCLTVLALAKTATSLPTLGKVQSAAVKGKLVCNGKPYTGAKVKLYDEDFGELDDLMDTKYTDKKGEFKVEGKETEYTTLDVKINVYHNCNDEQKECLRKFSVKIPDNYITDGAKAKKTFDIGTINLDAKFTGETRDCVN